MTTIDSHSKYPHDNARQCLPSDDVSVVLLNESDELANKCKDVHEREHVENLLALFVEPDVEVAIDNISISILTDECPVHVAPPAIDVDIFEVHVAAWVGLIASNDAWRKETTLGTHIPECNILDINQRLSWAGLEWVSHAASTSAIRLFLLLRTNVNAVPDWVMDVNVLIKNIFDLSCASITWIRLDINRLHRILKLDILESNATNASVGVLWWH